MVGAIRAAASFSVTAESRSRSSRDGGASSSNAQKTTVRTPLLSASKRSWVVKTQYNVGREWRNKANPPCVVCGGSGRVDCDRCNGRGRTNHVELEMLPKGHWPKWCRCCGGSGLSNCSRCLGTGEYRHIMGFDFMFSQSTNGGDG
ncbi:unnamed protein product [Cuscuta campestris]|uniref:Uncharacterized protein n=2 Tax=Cuscuta sect. Cleistogrammica TaxID=1824901 RepID=A0A484N583_9ASTE|nr:hypothetical protein DM860_004444 [Cuscuta australis]VFQ95777.1 unnamed protein product [Cuscuta campestris]